MPLSMELLSKVRRLVTKGAMTVLGPEIESGPVESITSSLVMSSTEVCGFGVVDISAIAASTEVRMLTLGNASPNPSLKACHENMIKNVRARLDGAPTAFAGHAHAERRVDSLATMGLAMHEGGQQERQQMITKGDNSWVLGVAASEQVPQAAEVVHKLAYIALGPSDLAYIALSENDVVDDALQPTRRSQLGDSKAVWAYRDPYVTLFYALNASIYETTVVIMAVHTAQLPADYWRDLADDTALDEAG